jgi:hypothetical protein
MLDIYGRAPREHGTPIIHNPEFFRVELAPLADGQLKVASRATAWMASSLATHSSGLQCAAMLQELYRVAKPNARLIIRVPHGGRSTQLKRKLAGGDISATASTSGGFGWMRFEISHRFLATCCISKRSTANDTLRNNSRGGLNTAAGATGLCGIICGASRISTPPSDIA